MENQSVAEVNNNEQMQAQPAAVEIVSTPSVELNKTFLYTLTHIGFDCLSEEYVRRIFHDGRAFSQFIEPWLAEKFPLKHITGCKNHDHEDIRDAAIKYDQKTFTANGCNFKPSNMIGEGRIFNQTIFEEKAKKLIYIIVSNIAFPLIKVRFVRGSELLLKYPRGKIPLKDHVKFFD